MKIISNTPEKYTIKIPNDVTVIYSSKKKIIVLAGVLSKKALKLNVQLFLIKSKNIIKVIPLPFFKISNNEQKKIKALQGTTVALIKQLIVETSAVLYRKLKLIGVGYRAFDVDNLNNKLLLFKLGYSHFLYFRISNEVKKFCLKMTKLFIYGNSYQNVTQIASLIRSYKKPEPYKGKGILNETEKIILKEGKKV
jgi:large subunit ribosomal protein L6